MVHVVHEKAEIWPAHRARALVSFALEPFDRKRAQYKRTRLSYTPPVQLVQNSVEKECMSGEFHLKFSFILILFFLNHSII